MLTDTQLEALCNYGELGDACSIWLWLETRHMNGHHVADGIATSRMHSLSHITGTIRRKCRHIKTRGTTREHGFASESDPNNTSFALPAVVA